MSTHIAYISYKVPRKQTLTSLQLVLEPEMSIGPDLDWTGSGLLQNFVEFGLDPDCTIFQILGSGPDLDLVNRRGCGIFVVKMLHFSNILDFDCAFEKNFGLCLDLDWVLKNQDCICIEKYDGPLISGSNPKY